MEDLSRQEQMEAPGRVTIGDRVWARRKQVGLTQQELAHKSLTSRATVVRIEAGQQMPSTKTLQRLAKALSCPLTTLIG